MVANHGIANRAWACSHCNLHKGANVAGIDSGTGDVTPRFDPRRERWVDHFRFVGGRIIGKSNRGRVTVAALDLNDPDCVRLRESLIVEGVFSLTADETL